jgi:hypothetical protein
VLGDIFVDVRQELHHQIAADVCYAIEQHDVLQEFEAIVFTRNQLTRFARVQDAIGVSADALGDVGLAEHVLEAGHDV